MPNWSKDKVLQHGPDLPIADRVRRYQHNVRTIRASAYIDTLDPVAIEMWFLESAERRHRLKAAIQGLAALPPEPEPD